MIIFMPSQAEKKWKLRQNGKKIRKVLLIKIYVYVAVKVPITPKIFLAHNKSLYSTEQDSAKIFSFG